MKKLLMLIAIASGIIVGIDHAHWFSVQAAEANQNSDELLTEAFKTHRSDFQIQVQASVLKLLPDDVNGSKHQRFIVSLNSGHTLLVAHNLDLAPRIDNLKEGDSIEFSGEYEWNKKGGVIHWTHHDPQSRHVAGWIRHGGQLYQ